MPKITYLPTAGAKNYDIKKSLPTRTVEEIQRNMREWQARQRDAQSAQESKAA